MRRSYVEYAKPSLKSSAGESRYETLCVFALVLERALCQLHPFLPFETEEIHRLLAADLRHVVVEESSGRRMRK